MLVVSMIFLSLFPFVFGGWYGWDLMSHSVVWTRIGMQLFFPRIGHDFIYPMDSTGSYYEVRAAGWHPF
jgi:hypothetical protein